MNKIKKNILATGLLSTVSAIALAGGGLNMASPTNFTGFFGGAQMGVHSGNMNTDTTEGFGKVDDNDDVSDYFTKVAAGIFAGYGKQFNNNVYLGLSGDLNWVNSQLKENDDLSDSGVKIADLQTIRKVSPTYSADVELGYVINQTVLLFMTGGYAGAHVTDDIDITVLTTSTVTNNHAYSNGYNLGLGVRAMLTKNIFLQGKGTYASLGKVNATTTLDGSTLAIRFKPDFYQILFGVGYKF